MTLKRELNIKAAEFLMYLLHMSLANFLFFKKKYLVYDFRGKRLNVGMDDN